LNRYFTYCRKSSEDEDHQVLSIESQRKELQQYVDREHLQIVAVKEEARSARTPGRAVFNDILKRIERGEADGIVAWHPDRLARNALDGGQVIQLLDTGKLKSLRFPTYTFENTSQGKFMLAIMFGQSKYYVDSLSENIRRGNRTKREKGWLPSRAPIGYLNARSEAGEKIIVPDPDRFAVLKRMWELLLSGGYSAPQLLDLATNDFGLRTPKRKRIGGSSLSVSGIYRVFSNPFYAGHILYQDHWYPGKHEPMITVGQFEQVQVLLGRSSRARPQEHVFAYSGLMKCGLCGSSITMERKVNRYGSRYVYYHCTHKRRDLVCRETSLEEGQLEEQILDFLSTIRLDQRELDRLLALIEQERAKEIGAEGGIKQALEKALESCVRNLDSLTKLRYRELIGDDEFIRQRAGLSQEQSKLQQKIAQLKAERWIAPSQKLFLFSNRAVFWLTHGNPSEKRLIISTVGSHLSLRSKQLSIDAKKPFQILQERGSLSTLWRVVNDVRTFFSAEPDFEIPELPEPVLVPVESR
jgi:site-specific DNA recombinase